MSRSTRTPETPICLGDVVKRKGFDDDVGIVAGRNGDWVRVVWNLGASRTHPMICGEKELRHLTNDELAAAKDMRFPDERWNIQT